MPSSRQIIGRGTRIREDYNKRFFTIIDFKRATELSPIPTSMASRSDLPAQV